MKKGRIANILMFLVFLLVVALLLLLSKNKGNLSMVWKDISGIFS